jgi:hypothetical protein
MNNIILKRELKDIKASFNPNVTVEKGKVSGNSINIFDNGKFEDIGTYTYYGNVEARDADFDALVKYLN